jgi:hypothetical protein
MKAIDLYKKAKLATANLNPIIDTVEMRKTIMFSVVAQWVYDAEPYVNGKDIAINVVETARKTIEIIYENLED